jgi:hypothetical protein
LSSAADRVACKTNSLIFCDFNCLF